MFNPWYCVVAIMQRKIPDNEQLKKENGQQIIDKKKW